MAESKELEQRLCLVESQLELRTLAARYFHALDARDLAALGELFTEDAVLRSSDGVLMLRGRTNLIDGLRSRLATQGPSNHFGHDHVVEFDRDDADRATGVLKAHAELILQGRCMIAAIVYRDGYRRTTQGWRFTLREAGYFYFVQADSYASALAGALRMQARSEPQPADYPESLPSWRAFYDPEASGRSQS